MNALDERTATAYYPPKLMLTGSRTAQAAARMSMRTGRVWSVVDHAERVHAEYAAGACPSIAFGTIGTKRNQPTPWRALDA